MLLVSPAPSAGLGGNWNPFPPFVFSNAMCVCAGAAHHTTLGALKRPKGDINVRRVGKMTYSGLLGSSWEPLGGRLGLLVGPS